MRGLDEIATTAGRESAGTLFLAMVATWCGLFIISCAFAGWLGCGGFLAGTGALLFAISLRRMVRVAARRADKSNPEN